MRRISRSRTLPRMFAKQLDQIKQPHCIGRRTRIIRQFPVDTSPLGRRMTNRRANSAAGPAGLFQPRARSQSDTAA